MDYSVQGRAQTVAMVTKQGIAMATIKRKNMFSRNFLKRNAQRKNKVGRKFSKSSFEFKYTPATDSHSASENKLSSSLFTSTSMNNHQNPLQHTSHQQALIKILMNQLL